MTIRSACVIAALLVAILGCENNRAAFPLTIETLRLLSPANTSIITFEQNNGDIFVTIVDVHGDGHKHVLVSGSYSKDEAIGLLRQKQAEINRR